MNDWKRRLGVVYSTNPSFNYSQDSVKEGSVTLPPRKQDLRVSIDRRSRGGKQVTLITGFVGSDEDLRDLARELKLKCGVGGAARDGEIVLQGDLRDKIVALLCTMGYKAKRGN